MTAPRDSQSARPSPSGKKAPNPTGKRKIDAAEPAHTDTEAKRQKSIVPESASSSQPSSSTLPASSTPSAFPRAYTKHSRFWVLDGNTLLQIGIVRFKLHRSRLASQSPWFEKLFVKHAGSMTEVDTGDDDDSPSIDDVMVETVEGQDVFILDSTEVSIEDFEALLIAMDDGIDFYFASPSFRTVARILRAASTFRFRKLLKFAKAYVEDAFPDDVNEVTEERFKHAAEAVVLGRDWGVPLILKRAFYELARDDGTKVDEHLEAGPAAEDGLDGEENPEDGSEDDEDEDSESTQDDVEDDPMVGDGEDDEEVEAPQNNEDEFIVDQLDPRDIVLLMRGQKRLTDSWTSALAFEPLKACKSDCKGSRTRTNKGLFQPITPSGKKHIIQAYQFDPVCGINKLVKEDWKKTWGYCPECAQLRMEHLERKRQEIWESMDQWFELS